MNNAWLRRLLRVLPWAAVLLVLLTSLYLVINVEQETTQLSRHALWVFVSASVALVILLALITGRLIRLRQRLAADEPGAKLTARLVKIFSLLALPPVVVLYFFALQFLSETVEGWLDVQTERALAQSIELGQMFLDFRTREVRDQLQRLATLVEGVPDEDLYGVFLNRVSVTGPTEVTLLNAIGLSQLTVNIDPSTVLANLPNAFAISQVLENGEYAAAEPSENGLIIRTMRTLAPSDIGATPLILQAIYPLPSEFSDMASDIEQAYYRYRNVAFLRGQLEQSLVLILSLVLLLTALLALVLAFNAARRVSKPIRELAIATEELKAGRFPEAVETKLQDELGFLVSSFNDMTKELAHSRQALEAQRKYLEVVLERLSAGVLAVDRQGAISALNPAAAEILGLNPSQDVGASVIDIIERYPELNPLMQALQQRLSQPSGEWRQEIQIHQDSQLNRPLVLVCRGSDLPGEMGGHVVVFDDVTVLDEAQREAAWAEVARRLAHEVKNPLTPIQLAAERLEYKLVNEVTEEQAILLRRATSTIGAQVEALRRLVDAFGDYAKPKPPKMEWIDLTSIVKEVVDLYASAEAAIDFELTFDAVPTLMADAGRLRQVLLNLINNAEDARSEAGLIIEIKLAPSQRLGGSVQWSVTDNGVGLSPEILARAFDPYVSSKPGGTGLGLAIVKRIIEEHGGEIILEPAGQAREGTRVTIWLPIQQQRS